MAVPWDSPKVVSRNSFPNVLPAMSANVDLLLNLSFGKGKPNPTESDTVFDIGMTVKLLNSELLEGVVKTIMVFDILKLKVRAKEITDYLIQVNANYTDVEALLLFLKNAKILHSQNGYYQLYSRQEDSFELFQSPQLNLFQKLSLKLLAHLKWFDGLYQLDIGTRDIILIAKFPEFINSKKKDKRTQLLSNILGLNVYHSGLIPRSHRNVLTALIIEGLKPIVNSQSLLQNQKKNSWTNQFIKNKKVDFSDILFEPNPSYKSSLNNKLSSLKSTGKRNITSLILQLDKDLDFESEYSKRLHFASQWIMPQVRHLVKRNRIV